MKKYLFFMLVLALALVVFTACGGDDDDVDVPVNSNVYANGNGPANEPTVETPLNGAYEPHNEQNDYDVQDSLDVPDDSDIQDDLNAQDDLDDYIDLLQVDEYADIPQEELPVTAEPVARGTKPIDFGLSYEWPVTARQLTLPRQGSNPSFWFYITTNGNLYARRELSKTIDGGNIWYASGDETLIAQNVKSLFYINQLSWSSTVIFLDNDDNLFLVEYNTPSTWGAGPQTITSVNEPILIQSNVADIGAVRTSNTNRDYYILLNDGSVYLWRRAGNRTETVFLTRLSDNGAKLLHLRYNVGASGYLVLGQNGELFGHERDTFENRYVKRAYFPGVKVVALNNNPARLMQTFSGDFRVSVGDSGTAGFFPTQSYENAIESLLLWDSNTERYHIMRWFHDRAFSDGEDFIVRMAIPAIPENRVESVVTSYITWNDFTVIYTGTGGFDQLQLQRNENNTLSHSGQRISDNVQSFGAFGSGGANLAYLTYDGNFYLQVGNGLTFERRRENVHVAIVDGWSPTLVLLFEDGTLANSNGDIFATDVLLPSRDNRPRFVAADPNNINANITTPPTQNDSENNATDSTSQAASFEGVWRHISTTSAAGMTTRTTTTMTLLNGQAVQRITATASGHGTSVTIPATEIVLGNFEIRNDRLFIHGGEVGRFEDGRLIFGTMTFTR